MSGRQYSIRHRLVAGTVASMVIIFGGIGIAANQVARHESEEIFSARLATSARVLEALVANQLEDATVNSPLVIGLPREMENDSGQVSETYGHAYETKIAFQVWHDDGRMLARSFSAPSTPLGPLVAGFSKNRIGNQEWELFALHSGKVWVIAGEKDEVRQEIVDDLGMSILFPLIIGGGLMLLAVNLVLTLNTRSLRELAARIAKREPESLARIELPETPVELAPIVRELNELLSRVKAAFEREQRFIDAAAHEIRTPIAAVQVHVQNALNAPTEQERENSLAEALLGLRRTTKLAEQLLAFSRIAAKVDPEQFQTLSLNQLCREVVAEQDLLLAPRGQTIGLEAPHACLVQGEPHKIRRLLRNLIENASQYGAPHGDIQVEIELLPDSIDLRVCNEGPPIPEEMRDRIFSPYYRIPGQGSTGSGLGLAIVKEIADQHMAKVSVHSKAGDQGTIFTVSFPAVKRSTRHDDTAGRMSGMSEQ